MPASINDPTQVMVALDGRLFLADPDDTPTLPDSVDDAVVESAPWFEVGYITPDGVTYTDDQTKETIRAWQAPAPIRTIITSRDPSLTFAAMQWNPANLQLALGGGTMEEDGVMEGPLASDANVEKVAVLDFYDGDVAWRFLFRRVQVGVGGSFTLSRGTSANFSITLDILDPGEGNSFIRPFSNHEDFVAEAS